MSWTGEAYAEAERRDRADTDWYALSAESLFAEGAEWMRNQLRTNETIERLANALCVEEEGMTLAEHEANCELPVCGFRQSFLADARRNITALVGEG